MQQCEVQAGETLISISIRENVSVAALRRLNKLYGNEVFPGQVLTVKLPPKEVEVTNSITETASTSSDIKRVNSKNKVAATSYRKPIIVPDISPETNKPPSPQDDTSNDTSLSSSAALIGNTLLEAMTDTKAAMVQSADAKITSLRNFVNSLKVPMNPNENKNKNENGRVRAESATSVATLSVSYTETKTFSQDDLDKIDPTLSGKRNILTINQAKQLRAFLPSMQQIETWKLLYSVLNDGADMHTFFRKSCGHKYTVIIAQTMDGEIFGGFNSVEWNTSPNFYGSGEGFIFKFDSEDNMKQYPWTGENDFFVWCSQNQVAMGGGGDGFGFVLDSDFATGESYHCATYGNPILVEKENGAFRVANVECWGFEGIFGRASMSTQSNKLNGVSSASGTF